MDPHQYHHHDHDQYYHEMSLGNNHPYNSTINNTPQAPTSGSMIKDEQKMMTTRPQEARNCPRCNSSNTKFCYYNNYSLSQPRYLCKSCRRYWTDGGSLRNVPVGGGSRKNKKLPLLLPNSSKLIPDLNPPFLFTSSNPNNTHENINNNDLTLSFSVPLQTQGHFTDNTHPSPSLSGGQNRLFTAPMGMIQFRQEYEKGNVEFSLGAQEEEIGNKDDDHHHHDKMMYHYGNHMNDDDDDDDGRKKREEGGSSNEIWSGIILGGHSGGPTW